MAFLLVRHNVKDYETWKPFFDEHSSTRAEEGSKGGKIFRSADDPNELFILLEWDNIENAKKFAQSEKTIEAVQKAGIVGNPDIYFLEEAATISK